MTWVKSKACRPPWWLKIQRFVVIEEPEVLCIEGKWRVGKPFAWRHYLGAARESGDLANQNYAYGSTFGLNSLDDLRYGIFESTGSPASVLTGPDAETFGKLVGQASAVGRHALNWLGPVLETIKLGGVGNALARSAFLLVRNPLICIDDLKHAAAALQSRDVLGFACFPKKMRKRRAVLKT